MLIQNKRLVIIAIVVLILLLVPIVAMQFSKDVNWTLFDFIIAGILLLATGFAVEYVTRKVSKPKKRIVLYLVITSILLIIWLELAVGIFGTPISGS